MDAGPERGTKLFHAETRFVKSLSYWRDNDGTINRYFC